MKTKYLFPLLLVIFLASSVAFKAGVHDSERTMLNVFESSKTILSHSLATQNKLKFAYLTDSQVTLLGWNRYEVESYVDCENKDQGNKRVRYSMIVTWNGQEYTLENLSTGEI